MRYLLDANVFIQAKNLHYGLDFCPAFWEWLIKQNLAEKVYSLDKIADEVMAGSDELSVWVQNQGNSLFLETDQEAMKHFGSVSSWVHSQNYENFAIHIFSQVADFYLIAKALAGRFIVVTHEIPANFAKKIKIPNVCIGLDLKFMTPYDMLRREKAKFVLAGTT